MTESAPAGKNRLGNEKSPYLLQHKDNPVWWYPWGEEAFEAARKQRKPIFLSVGYSTCYWCHAMEKDSFEHQDVADLLNQHFISIKLDREERPDIDQIYMDAVVAISSHGGWPMSAFLTPELKPFWGGTYFPREDFKQILNRIHELWDTEHSKILESSESLFAFLEEKSNQMDPVSMGEQDLDNAYQGLNENFDSNFGGFGKGAKFPPSVHLSLLLRIHRRHKEENALSMVQKTAEAMIGGGIYDHLGGGFHRYATDVAWLVPHFEKMLYDNALIAYTLLEMYQVDKNEMWSGAAQATLDYVIREMTSSEGGFYSAQDAGGVGEEGAFYLWDYSELKSVLNESELNAFQEVYPVSDKGNFDDNKNIIFPKAGIRWEEMMDPKLTQIRLKLLTVRDKRVKPHLDDKILCSWNGLMIGAMALGSRVLAKKEYLDAAKKSASFLREKLFDGKTLLRRYRDGKSGISACAEDFAYVIHGLIELYQADFDSSWLEFAVTLQDIQDSLFWDSKGGGYFYSSAADIIVRRKEFLDGATPASNGVAARNLLRLHSLTLDGKYKDRAEKTLKAASGLVHQYAAGFSTTLQALDYLLDRSQEIAVVPGSEAESKEPLNLVSSRFLPNAVIACGKPLPVDSSALPTILRGKEAKSGKTTMYLCQEGACQLPVTSVSEFKEQLENLG